MKNLLTINISQEVIDQMIEINDLATVENLDANYEEVYKIIQFLKKIGIQKIDELLIFYPGLFMIDLKIFIDKIKNTNAEELIRKTNEDISFFAEMMYS